MSTIRLHADDHLDARAVHRRAHRLRAGPLEALWQQRRRLPQGASPGPHEADVTEGSGGIWERLHYDWSDPNRVVMTTTDSNLWGGGSGHTYTFTRRPDGKTDLDAVVVRDGKNLKGWTLGFVLGIFGRARPGRGAGEDRQGHRSQERQVSDTYQAVEVSAPGVLRAVERPVRDRERAGSGSGWKPAGSATAMRRRSPGPTRA